MIGVRGLSATEGRDDEGIAGDLDRCVHGDGDPGSRAISRRVSDDHGHHVVEEGRALCRHRAGDSDKSSLRDRDT